MLRLSSLVFCFLLSLGLKVAQVVESRQLESEPIDEQREHEDCLICKQVCSYLVLTHENPYERESCEPICEEVLPYPLDSVCAVIMTAGLCDDLNLLVSNGYSSCRLQPFFSSFCFCFSHFLFLLPYLPFVLCFEGKMICGQDVLGLCSEESSSGSTASSPNILNEEQKVERNVEGDDSGYPGPYQEGPEKDKRSRTSTGGKPANSRKYNR
jgi:hypothetical protein